MPVRLEAVPAGVSMPTPPRWMVWLLLFFMLTTFGVVLTLMLWPKGMPTYGARFWLILGISPLVWALLFGFRLHAYDEQINYANLRNHLREERLASETRRGQRAIRVIASAYETALGNADMDVLLLNGGDGFRQIVPLGGTDIVRCSTLPEGLRGTDSTSPPAAALIEHLLRRLGDDLQAVPQNVPVHVWLQVDAGIDDAALVAAWHEASKDWLPKVASLRLIEPTVGLLVLDQWLDAAASELERAVLLAVALQLRPTPADQEGEAAAAVLCHLGLERAACLVDIHRPAEFDPGNLKQQYAEALLWGTRDAQSFDAWWTSGFEPEFLNSMKSVIDASQFGEARSEGHRQFTLDVALGQTGAASGWLGVATAIERCRKEIAPQLVITNEQGHHRMLVISPLQA